MNDASDACDECTTEDEVIAACIGGTVLAVAQLQEMGVLTTPAAVEKIKRVCVDTMIATLVRFRARVAGASIAADLLGGPKAEGL
jgi:hypothetical protein